MSPRRKLLLIVLGSAALVAALLFIAVFLVPRLVNVDAVKTPILARLERETGVRVSFDRAELAWFPRPRLVLHEAFLVLPPLAEGTVKRIAADISPLGLLRNRFPIGSLLAESPDFRVRIPEREKGEQPPSLEKIEESASRLLSWMASRTPGATFEVRDGRLTLTEGSRPPLSLREIQARVSLPPDRLRFRLSCVSTHWEFLDTEGSLRSEGLRGEARVEVKGLRPLSILERPAPGKAAFANVPSLSAKARVESEGLRSLRADVSGTIPSLEVRRASRSLILKDATIESKVWLKEGNLRVSVSRFDLEAPRLRMSGTLAMDRESPRIRLELSGQEAEIPTIRSAVLSLAGDLPGVRSALDIVRGGSLSRLYARVSGDSAAELGDLRGVEASALLRGGVLSIPGIGLALTEVDGSLTLSKDTLTGKNVSARAEGARAREGSFRLGLAQPDPAFHAEFLAVADPEGLRPLVRRLIPDRGFLEELGRFKDLQGSIAGRVVLGERLSSIRPIVRATDMRLTARYDRVPFPLAIDGGMIAYEAGRVEVSGLGGRIGKSSFSGLAGRLDLGKPPKVTVRSGQARFSVDELAPWLSSTDFARETLRDVRSARGTVEVSSFSAEGTPGAPGEWRYESSGRVNDLVLEINSMPGPATIRRGGFRLLPGAALFSGIVAELLDAKAGGSAEIRYSGDGVSGIAASVDEGEFGPAMTAWASPRLQLPEGAAIRAPLSLSGAAFSWEKDGAVSFRGKLGHPGGASLSISLRKSPEELAIDSFSLRDRDSSADLSFHLGPKDLRVKYEGTLRRSAVEKFVAIPVHGFRRLEGSMDLSVDLESPGRSRARGTLNGEGIRVPWGPLDPLRIRSISVSADGRELRVASADLAWREVPFRMRGNGRFSRDGLEVDVDVEGGEVPLERLLGRTAGSVETAVGPGSPPVAEVGFRIPKLPVRGTFRLRSDSIRYDRWVVREVAASGELRPGGLEVSASGGDLCGLPLHGRAVLDSAGLELELRTTASGTDLNEPVMCLFDRRISMSGSFRFDTRLTARGRDKSSLIRSIAGPVEFTASDGRIYQMPLLSRILSVLNVTNVVRGKFPDFRRRGIAYDTLTIRGEYHAETLLVKEGTLRAPTLGIASTGEVDFRNSKVDMNVLAAPFRTADWIIRKIPLVRHIMKKTLVSVPLKVTGDVYNPTVAFDTAGAGSGLLGVLQRTIRLPLTIVEGVLPKSEPTE